MDTIARAQDLLTDLAGDGAVLRDDQTEAIRRLVDERARLLVVQRTGWGKSAVYFIATKLLREAGEGVVLLVSPLLALMRDQIAAARRMGLVAETVNSTNLDDWESIAERLDRDEIDLLLISPERLNNPTFRAHQLPELTRRIGGLVIDEAHCTSDWGHDFRPDYRRLRDVIAGLDERRPVLATTATANDRVVADVAAQLGSRPATLRGSLDRSSLSLAVVRLDTVAQRLAWLDGFVAAHGDGQGIVYTLTQADAEMVADWLASRGHPAAAYHGGLDGDERVAREGALLEGSLTVLAATTALSMGYDHPRLTFVAHLGAPPSPVAYYQAVGRAGRAVEHAEVVLLPQPHDEDIWRWMTSTAFPPEQQIRDLLAVLEAADGPMSTQRLEGHADLARSRIDLLLRTLDVEGVVERVRGGWILTGRPFAHDADRIARVTAAREAEQDAMRAYLDLPSCRMAYLRRLLDDDAAEPCGRCDRCTSQPPRVTVDASASTAAEDFLRGRTVVLPPRRRWPTGTARKGAIADGRLEAGRALARTGDGGWSGPVTRLLDGDGEVIGEIVSGLVEVLADWSWSRRPTWVTWLPDETGLAQRVAERIGAVGRLAVHEAVRREVGQDPDARANSTQQAAAAAATIGVHGPAPVDGPVLLVTTVVDSGWPQAAAADALVQAGAHSVLPLALLTVR